MIGCKECYPETAEQALTARSRLTLLRIIAEDSQHRITVFQCPACAQQFVNVLTETIDLVDGEDPVIRQTMPISAEEAGQLAALAALAAETHIYMMGAQDRRCLVQDWRKGDRPRVFWASGLRRNPHQ